jgi:WD40 repeat protein
LHRVAHYATIGGGANTGCGIWLALTEGVWRDGDCAGSVYDVITREHHILSASGDRSARLWHVDREQSLQTLQSDAVLWCACFAGSKGSHGVAGSWDGAVSSWDLETGAFCIVSRVS